VPSLERAGCEAKPSAFERKSFRQHGWRLIEAAGFRECQALMKEARQLAGAAAEVDGTSPVLAR